MAKPLGFPLLYPRGHFGFTWGRFSFPFTMDESCVFVISFPFLCFSNGWVGGL